MNNIGRFPILFQKKYNGHTRIGARGGKELFKGL